MRERYQITERVDQGGMAEVFRGISESMGFKKAVAIKRILPHLAKNEKFVSMFLDEARLSLHLQHANIVQVFDIGKGQAADAAYFIVMEYIDGVNLKGLVDHMRKSGTPMHIGMAVYLMIEVCKGLAYAHDATDPETMEDLGIVHRDISPPNILVSRNGEVKLVDFGLAKATSQLETTDPGVVKGKFSYLSPEAASGTAVDHRADIFAVGILLWELITGRRLFYGDTDFQTVELVRRAQIPSLSAINPDAGPDLEAIVRKALEQSPDNRYQHAGDLHDALAHFLFARGQKVTSRDLAKSVRKYLAQKKKDKPKAASDDLINTFIQDEIGKFTSLDDLENDPLADPHSPLSPESVSGEARPLDPASFIDTRDWTGDLEVPAELIADNPPAPKKAASVGSLQQVVEPEAAAPAPTRARAHAHAAPGKAREPRTQLVDAGSQKSLVALIFVAIILAAALGGGFLMFKDEIFGGNGNQDTPTQKR